MAKEKKSARAVAQVEASKRDEALEKAYAAVGKISFEGMHFRRDIGRTK